MADLQKYVNWDGLVYYDGKIKDFIKDKLSPCFKFAGVFTSETLPAPESELANYIFQVSNDFTSNELFDVQARSYKAGALIYVKQIEDGQYRYSILVEAPTITTSEITKKFDDIEAAIDSQATDIADANEAIKSIEADVDTSVENISKLKSDVDVLKTTQESQSETLDDIKGSVEAFDAEIDRVDNVVSDIKSEQEKSKETVTAITENIKTVEQAVEEKQDKLTAETQLGTINDLPFMYGQEVKIDVPNPVFTIDKLTDIEVGGIPVGTDLNGWTVSAILKKLLYKVVADVTTNYNPEKIAGTDYGPVFVGSTATEEYSAPVDYKTLTETPNDPLSYAEEGYYKVLDAEGNVTQTGFQATVPGAGRTAKGQILISVQPKQILLWDPLQNIWTDYQGTWELVKTVTVEAADGTAMSYYLYEDSNGAQSEKFFRFVI